MLLGAPVRREGHEQNRQTDLLGISQQCSPGPEQVPVEPGKIPSPRRD